LLKISELFWLTNLKKSQWWDLNPRPFAYKGSNEKFEGHSSNALSGFRCSLKSLSWNNYHDWLLKNKEKHYANVIFHYSQRYWEYAFSNSLLTVNNTRKKSDILKAIANLTRFLDIHNDTFFHEEFTRWLKRKEIKWGINHSQNNYHISNNITMESVLNNLKKQSPNYKLFGTFVLVSGLRTEEARTAFNNHQNLCRNGILEMFWDRNTKKTNAVYCHPLLHNKMNFELSLKSIYRKLNSKLLGCELRYLRKLNYTVNATKIDPLLAEFMQGRRGNVSQRHYFLPLMQNNKRKWIRMWESVIKRILL